MLSVQANECYNSANTGEIFTEKFTSLFVGLLGHIFTCCFPHDFFWDILGASPWSLGGSQNNSPLPIKRLLHQRGATVLGTDYSRHLGASILQYHSSKQMQNRSLLLHRKH